MLCTVIIDRTNLNLKIKTKFADPHSPHTCLDLSDRPYPGLHFIAKRRKNHKIEVDKIFSVVCNLLLQANILKPHFCIPYNHSQQFVMKEGSGIQIQTCLLLKSV